MAEGLKLVKPTHSEGGAVPSTQTEDQQKIIKALQEHLKLAEGGSITGLILLGVGDQKITRQAIGMNPYTQLAILARTAHQVNHDWDKA